jgi:hypothetical protein
VFILSQPSYFILILQVGEMSSSKSKRLITDSDEEMDLGVGHLSETRSTNNSTTSHVPNQPSNVTKSSSSGEPKETQKEAKVRKSTTRSRKKNDDDDYEVSFSFSMFILSFFQNIFFMICVCVRERERDDSLHTLLCCL